MDIRKLIKEEVKKVINENTFSGEMEVSDIYGKLLDILNKTDEVAFVIALERLVNEKLSKKDTTKYKIKIKIY